MGFTTEFWPLLWLARRPDTLTVASQVLCRSNGWARGVGGSWVEKILESSHSSAWCCHCNRKGRESNRVDREYYCLTSHFTTNQRTPKFGLNRYLKSRRTRLGHRLIRVQRSGKTKQMSWSQSLLNKEGEKGVLGIWGKTEVWHYKGLSPHRKSRRTPGNLL